MFQFSNLFLLCSAFLSVFLSSILIGKLIETGQTKRWNFIKRGPRESKDTRRAFDKISIIEGIKLGFLKGTVHRSEIAAETKDTSLNVTFRRDIRGGIKIRDAAFLVAK